MPFAHPQIRGRLRARAARPAQGRARLLAGQLADPGRATISRGFEPACLERLRQVVSDSETCSAGVCVWNGNESVEALLDRADTALYEAKDAGRDEVVVAA